MMIGGIVEIVIRRQRRGANPSRDITKPLTVDR